MKRIIFILSIILLINFFGIQAINGGIVAPSVMCEIIADVLQVEMAETDFEGLRISPITDNVSQVEMPRANQFKGVGMPPRTDFEYWKVKLDITEITTFRKNSGDLGSCDNSYIETAEKVSHIMSLSDYNNNPIQQGQKIRATIEFGGDEWFNGSFLENVQILENEREDSQMQMYMIIIVIIIILLGLLIFIKKNKF